MEKIEYSIDRLNELIEFCKAEPRDFKITRKTIRLYNFNKENILPFLPMDKYVELLQETFNLIKEDVYVDGNIVIFFKYLFLYNIHDTRPFFLFVDLLELLKKRFTTEILMDWIYRVSSYYANYIESVDFYHEDLAKIYEIKTRNRYSYEGGIEEIAKGLRANSHLLFHEPFINPSVLYFKNLKPITENIEDFLLKKTNKLDLNIKKASMTHGMLSSVFYYITRNIIYKNEDRVSKIIERIISGLEEIINSYLDNYEKFNPSSFLRIVTIIAAKNSIKLRYNIDNNIFKVEDILKDYTDELAFVYNKRIYQIGVETSVKFLQEMHVLQSIYNYYNIDADVFNQFKEVSLFLMSSTKIDLLRMNKKDFDIKTFMLESAIPLFGADVFFEDEEDISYEMFSGALNDYYNIFNDKMIKKETSKKRKFNLDYVYK